MSAGRYFQATASRSEEARLASTVLRVAGVIPHLPGCHCAESFAPHLCPFVEEITWKGTPGNLCVCCEHCAEQCAYDI